MAAASASAQDRPESCAWFHAAKSNSLPWTKCSARSCPTTAAMAGTGSHSTTTPPRSNTAVVMPHLLARARDQQIRMASTLPTTLEPTRGHVDPPLGRTRSTTTTTPARRSPHRDEGCAVVVSSRDGGRRRCDVGGRGPHGVRDAAARRRRFGWRSAQGQHGGATASRALLEEGYPDGAKGGAGDVGTLPADPVGESSKTLAASAEMWANCDRICLVISCLLDLPFGYSQMLRTNPRTYRTFAFESPTPLHARICRAHSMSGPPRRH